MPTRDDQFKYWTSYRTEKDNKRWAKADNVLSGNINYSSWYMAVAVNFNNDGLLAAFTTTPTGTILAGFDSAIDTVVSSIWNDISGINITD